MESIDSLKLNKPLTNEVYSLPRKLYSSFASSVVLVKDGEHLLRLQGFDCVADRFRIEAIYNHTLPSIIDLLSTYLQIEFFSATELANPTPFTPKIEIVHEDHVTPMTDHIHSYAGTYEIYITGCNHSFLMSAGILFPKPQDLIVFGFGYIQANENEAYIKVVTPSPHFTSTIQWIVDVMTRHALFAGTEGPIVDIRVISPGLNDSIDDKMRTLAFLGFIPNVMPHRNFGCTWIPGRELSKDLRSRAEQFRK